MTRTKSFLFVIVTLFISNLNAGWAEDTLEHMSLKEKIGQLFMIRAFSKNQDFLPCIPIDQSLLNLIKNYHIGGLIFFQGDPETQVKLTNYYQRQSPVPLLIGQDCEWGLGMRLKKAISYPKNLFLGKIKNYALIHDLGKEIGRQCKALGIHINFAPVIDVNTNPNNPVIGIRSFSEDKEEVVKNGLAFATGLLDAGIIPSLKHFPGHGDTDKDSHLDLPIINHNLERLFSEELYPFNKMIEQLQNNISIMIAHLSVPKLEPNPKLPTTLSRKVVTGLLKEQLGFNGLIISDALEMKGVLKYFSPEQAAFLALKAGNDILLCPQNIPESIELIKQAIKEEIILEQELDDHVLKILKAKEKLNLHNQKLVPEENIIKRINTEYAYKLKEDLLGHIAKS